MPTYEYECDGCGHAFEQWQSFSEEQLTKCPSCKKKKLRRLFGSGAAILFKGSGFYETDYNRDEKYKSAEKADNDAATATPAKSESKSETTASAGDSKTESKPATAPESGSGKAGKSAGSGQAKKGGKK